MTKDKPNTIELERFRTPGAKIFTGRDRGRFVREKSHLDEIESKYTEVTVVIPDNIYSIGPSFFEELFVNVVDRLGKQEFERKFKFENVGDYNYKKPLNEAIERLIRKKTAIG